jgi:hypothetical protein
MATRGVQCSQEMATQLFPSSEPPIGSQVETGAPRVTLRNYFAHPFDSAIAAARTCYSPRLIGPEEITDKQRVTIGSATYYTTPYSSTLISSSAWKTSAVNLSGPFFMLIRFITQSNKASGTCGWIVLKLMCLKRARISAQPSAPSTKELLRERGIFIASSLACCSQPLAEFLLTSGTLAPCRIRNACKKWNARRKSARLRWHATFCR